MSAYGSRPKVDCQASLKPDYTPLRRYAHPCRERWCLGPDYDDAGIDFFVQIRDGARLHVRILHGHFQVFFAEQKLCDIACAQAGQRPPFNIPVEGGRVSIVFDSYNDFEERGYLKPLYNRGYGWVRRQLCPRGAFCVVPCPEGLDHYLAWYEDKRKQVGVPPSEIKWWMHREDIEPEWTFMHGDDNEFQSYFSCDDIPNKHSEWMHPSFMQLWHWDPPANDGTMPDWLRRSHWRRRSLDSSRRAASLLASEFSVGQSVEICDLGYVLTQRECYENLNGVIARIKSYNPEDGRWEVELPSSDWVLLHRNWLKVVG